MGPLVRRLCTAAFLAIALPGLAAAQPVEPVLALAKKERQPLLDTLKELVSIEPRLYLLARLIMDVSQGRDRN